METTNQNALIWNLRRYPIVARHENTTPLRLADILSSNRELDGCKTLGNQLQNTCWCLRRIIILSAQDLRHVMLQCAGTRF